MSNPARALTHHLCDRSEGVIGTGNLLHHGPLAVRMYNKRTFSPQYVTLSSDAIRCFHIGNTEETGTPAHSEVCARE